MSPDLYCINWKTPSLEFCQYKHPHHCFQIKKSAHLQKVSQNGQFLIFNAVFKPWWNLSSVSNLTSVHPIF